MGNRHLPLESFFSLTIDDSGREWIWQTQEGLDSSASDRLSKSESALVHRKNFPRQV